MWTIPASTTFVIGRDSSSPSPTTKSLSSGRPSHLHCLCYRSGSFILICYFFLHRFSLLPIINHSFLPYPIMLSIKSSSSYKVFDQAGFTCAWPGKHIKGCGNSPPAVQTRHPCSNVVIPQWLQTCSDSNQLQQKQICIDM